MSKEFFSVLGDELCTIKNSPFYKLGQKPTGLEDPNILRSQLSYDPDRLFNKDRYEKKNEGIEDQDFIEMKQEERRNEQRIEF